MRSTKMGVFHMRISTKVFSSCAAVTWLLALPLGSARADEKTPVGGMPVGGLRLRVEPATIENGKTLQPQCNVVFENVGDSDLNVQLGFSLANGKSHHTKAVRFFARSKDNKTRTFIYAAIPGVAGRVDPFVVPLPAGSSYTLRCEFDKYADSETGERIDLVAKDYRIAAELIGEAITKTNQNVRGLTLIPCWEEKVRSKEVQLPFATTEHTEWVSQSLREMQTIERGMTREELLQVFIEEGGISTRFERRFAYRHCPYIKVDVKFEPVGASDDKLTNYPKDKVKEVSKPFLEWSIVD